MRRQIRTIIVILVVMTVAGLTLGFQTIDLGDFERGDDTLLGLKLGLDLQGGSHLVYQARDNVTGEPIVPEPGVMESLKRSIEKRVNSSGLGEPIIQLLGDDRILVQLPGVEDLDRAKSLIGETAQLVFKHRTLNAPRPLAEISGEDIVAITAGLAPEPPGAVATSSAAEAETLDEDRPVVVLIEFTSEGARKFDEVVTRLNDSLIEALGGGTPPGRLELSIAGEQSMRLDANALTLQRVEGTNQFAFGLPVGDAELPAADVEAVQALLGDDPTVEFTEVLGARDDDIGLTGEDLKRAYASQQQASGAPIINIEFNERGTRIFGDLTSEIVGTTDSVAIFLDGVELIAPVVQSPITSGTAIIQGRDFTLERVRDLSLLLEAGTLPVNIGEPIQERDVDAILGSASLSKSVTAGAIGLVLVLVFMAMYYRVPGAVAVISLIFYATIVLAIFKLLPITLTLSGIAAVILSVGMAVDANILIFERTKDELRVGRTLVSAINNGFDRAWPAIRDSNVSTLITCMILFYFSNQLGTTVVQGFAVALAVGVAVSMFTAIVVSRTLLRAVAATAISRKLNWFVPSGGAELPQLQTTPATQRS